MTYSETDKHFFTRSINFKGVELDIEFRFYQAIPASKDESESPEEVIIEAVFVDEIEISSLLGEKTVMEIEKELLKLYDNKET